MDEQIDKKPVVSEAEGTPEVDVETSLPDTEVNEEEGSDGVESTESSQPKEENAPKQTKRNPEAEAGKISALQKQLNQLEALRSKVSTFFQKNKGGYEQFRSFVKETENIDLGEYERIYGGNESTLTETPKQPTTQAPSLDSVKQVVRQELKFEMEAEQGFKEFVTAFPDMDPAKMDETKKQEIGPVVRQIESIAYTLKQQNPEMSLGKAYITAYRAINPEVLEAKAREEGEMTGRLKELGKGSAASSAPSSSAPSTGSVDISFLTPSQRERYLELKQTPGKETIAELYLSSAKERRGR